jgi:pilus assembly protein Flp/PilA
MTGAELLGPLRHARRRRAGELTMNLIAYVRALIKNEEGQDLLEYALLIALIALVCVGAVGTAGNAVKDVFTSIAGSIPSA